MPSNVKMAAQQTTKDEKIRRIKPIQRERLGG
jgi:hypothetical protein